MIPSLQPFGDCLQIGLGTSNAAAQIAAFHPQSHTIIEHDPFLIQKEERWFQKHPHVKFVFGFWQEILPAMGLFDTIYCEIREVGSLWPEFAHMRYGEKELDVFCKETANSAPEQLFRFLHELAHNGQISSEQLKETIHKYKLKGSIPQLKNNHLQTVACLKLCLDGHMRSHSRFGAPLISSSSLYNEPLFNQIALDPFVEIIERDRFVIVEKIGS